MFACKMLRIPKETTSARRAAGALSAPGGGLGRLHDPEVSEILSGCRGLRDYKPQQ